MCFNYVKGSYTEFHTLLATFRLIYGAAKGPQTFQELLTLSEMRKCQAHFEAAFCAYSQKPRR
jgi:hypothetical protein